MIDSIDAQHRWLSVETTDVLHRAGVEINSTTVLAGIPGWLLALMGGSTPGGHAFDGAQRVVRWAVERYGAAVLDARWRLAHSVFATALYAEYRMAHMPRIPRS